MTDDGQSQAPDPQEWFDERGARCPAPIIALAKALRGLPRGSVIGLVADDPAAAVDVPAWCRLKGAELLSVKSLSDDQGGMEFVVRLPI